MPSISVFRREMEVNDMPDWVIAIFAIVAFVGFVYVAKNKEKLFKK